MFKLAERSETEQLEAGGDRVNPEAITKEVMEKCFGVKLEKKSLTYSGSTKSSTS